MDGTSDHRRSNGRKWISMENNAEAMAAKDRMNSILGVSDERVEEIVKLVKHAMIDNESPSDVMIVLADRLHHKGELLVAGTYLGQQMK